MLDMKKLFGLVILPLTFVSCKSEFEVLRTRTAAPANVRIDFKVNKPTKDIRPVRINEDYYLDMIDLRKISIKEDGQTLSMSEGGSASVSRCADCSRNMIHLTLDYSGSVRDQFHVVKENAIKFLRTLDSNNTRIRISFFAGDSQLYNPLGYDIYKTPESFINWLSKATCADFYTADDRRYDLCSSDRATRLKTAIVKNIDGLEGMDSYYSSQKMNVTRTSVIFTDGKDRDKDFTLEQVKNKIENFKKKGGLFYTVMMSSDEADKKFINNIQPSKNFKLSKVHQLSDRLNDVLEDVHALTPLYFTLKICSATRGHGKTTLDVSSKKYNIKASVDYDTGSFGGGCDLKNAAQWQF